MNTEHQPESVENYIEGLGNKLLDDIHDDKTFVAAMETDVDVEPRYENGYATGFIKHGTYVRVRLETPDGRWIIQRDTQ